MCSSGNSKYTTILMQYLASENNWGSFDSWSLHNNHSLFFLPYIMPDLIVLLFPTLEYPITLHAGVLHSMGQSRRKEASQSMRMKEGLLGFQDNSTKGGKVWRKIIMWTLLEQSLPAKEVKQQHHRHTERKSETSKDRETRQCRCMCVCDRSWSAHNGLLVCLSLGLILGMESAFHIYMFSLSTMEAQVEQTHTWIFWHV